VISQEEIAQRHQSIFGAKPPKQPYVPPPLPEELRTIGSFEKLLGTTQLPPGRT
jgi:hypothetical protein